MCYGSCPYQKSFSGECNNPIGNSKNPNAHCFEGFVCSKCEDAQKEDNEWADGICLDCADTYNLKKCVSCGYVSEFSERQNVLGKENNICPDCGEKL